MDGVDRCLHTFGDLLHIDIGGGCRSRVPKHTLPILYCALLLCERRNRSPDDPECQLWQSQVFRQFVTNPLPVVAQLLAVLERLQSMFGVGRRGAHISRTGGATDSGRSDGVDGDLCDDCVSRRDLERRKHPERWSPIPIHKQLNMRSLHVLFLAKNLFEQ